MNDNYDEIEEEVKEKDTEEKKVKHKVSGRSVFELQEIIASRGNLQKQIIKKKSEVSKEEDASSGEAVAGEK